MDTQLYTITIFTENTVGLLHQISMIFSRRCLNIDSITASFSSIDGVHKWTITCRSSLEMMRHVVKQIEKRIDVIMASLNTDDELIFQEIALFKVPTANVVSTDIEQIVRENGVRILEIHPEYTILEKTGHTDEIEHLFEKLKPLGLRQYVKSGRVAVTKDTAELLSEHLERQEVRRIKSQTEDSNSNSSPEG